MGRKVGVRLTSGDTAVGLDEGWVNDRLVEQGLKEERSGFYVELDSVVVDYLSAVGADSGKTEEEASGEAHRQGPVDGVEHCLRIEWVSV